MTAPRNALGQTLTIPEPSGPDLAAALAEACLRLAINRIKCGELIGHCIPDPLSRWRTAWEPIAGDEVCLTIMTAAALDRDQVSAVSERLIALGFDPVLAIVRGEGYDWSIGLTVSPL